MNKKNVFLSIIICLTLINLSNYLNQSQSTNESPLSASFNGSSNVPLEINETQKINFGNFENVNTIPVSFNGWQSENFNMTITNSKDGDFSNTSIQDDTGIEDTFSISSGGSYMASWYKPQEIGTNLNLAKKSLISDIYLRLGMGTIYTSGGSENIENYKQFIGNITVEVRNDDGSGVPLKDQKFYSIPLKNCIIKNDSNVNYLDKSIEYALNNPQDLMIRNTTICFSPMIELNTGNYWVIINQTHQITDSINNLNFKVNFYNNGNDMSNYVNRSFDSLTYSTNDNFYITDDGYDMYFKYTAKALEYTADEIDLHVDSIPVASNGQVTIPKVASDSTSFTLTSTPATLSHVTKSGQN